MRLDLFASPVDCSKPLHCSLLMRLMFCYTLIHVFSLYEKAKILKQFLVLGHLSLSLFQGKIFLEGHGFR